jgi:hypothetical protein
MRFAPEVTVGQLIIDAPGYLRYVHPSNGRDRAWPGEFRLERAPQTPYSGQVISGDTGAPVTRGEVTWESADSSGIGTRIDPQGVFRIDVPIASDVASGRLTIDAPGYEPLIRSVEIRRGQPTAEFRLVALPPTPTPTPIPPFPTVTPLPTTTSMATATATLTLTVTPDPSL